MANCTQCSSAFEITEDDLVFYDRVSPIIGGKKFPVPPPTHCPDCRQQRRLSYRNERNFYKRKSMLSGKEIVSIYSEDKPCKVFGQTEWWSDDWDQLETGRIFDFNKPFFTQYLALSNDAPRPCIINMSSDNSLFTNHCCYNKNCYMCVNTGYCEDSYYLSNFSTHSNNCMDCLAIQNCELCFECIDTKKTHSSTHLLKCTDCTDCYYCYDCNSCNNCIGCWNLRHKSYCINNKQLSPEEYKKESLKIKPETWKESEGFRRKISDKAIHKNLSSENCENSTGDYIYECKNVKSSFHVFDSEDCSYCYDCGDTKNSIDAYEPYHAELQHETHACNLGYSFNFCSKSYESNNLIYCQYCWYCSDCFGCFGIRNKKHCILNRQYSKEEYEALVPKIIEHMKSTSEWGEFFPTNLSSFAYNETVADEYFPMTKEEVLSNGWKWKDDIGQIPDVEKIIEANQLPDNIDEIPDDILNWTIKCEETDRPFKIVKQELEFYRKMKLPIPHLHPDIRHNKRMALRNPRKLWDRKCNKCEMEIKTTYSPERPEKVYCERCYLEAVY